MEIERLGENKIRCALSEEEIREMVNNGKAVFYIGFDPTADSLHVGHFMACGGGTGRGAGQYQYAEYFTGSEGRTFAGSQHGDHVWRRFRDEF